MKRKEELNEIKEEVENLNKKLEELTEEELTQVVGGQSQSWHIYSCVACLAQFLGPGPNVKPDFCPYCGSSAVLP